MTSNSNRRVLIVDDNESIHTDFKSILSPDRTAYTNLTSIESNLFDEKTPLLPAINFEVDCASQGQEGYAKVIEAAKAGRPYAVAFVDVRMPPGWDGIQTVERIWAEHPELEVVICTAHSDYTWEQMLEKLGRSDQLLVLKKPFDTIEVLQVAHALTGKWNLAHRLQAHMAEVERKVAEQTREFQEFAHSVLADLRDPLRNVGVFNEQLREKFGCALGDNGLDCLTRIHEATAQMTRLIDGFLAVSRLPKKSDAVQPGNSPEAGAPLPALATNP
jgi:CheY-like chemotaxis protein